MQFFKKYKNRMIVISVAIILIIIIGFTSTGRVSVTKLENGLGQVFTPIGRFFYGLGDKGANLVSSVKNITSLKAENEKLKKENIDLKEKNRDYEIVVGKKDYLKAEFEMLGEQKYDLISANIIGKEPGNWFNRFSIDKGLNDGVKKGDTIISAVEGNKGPSIEGIVGRVVESGNNYSKVVSLIDENSKVSFKLTRTEEGGMLSGSDDGKLIGYLFDTDADVKKGDELLSSGLGGVYSKDLYIGRVTKVVRKDEELMKTIEVEPAINFKKLHRVFIISNER